MLRNLLGACAIVSLAAPVAAEEKVDPNSQYYFVKNYYVPTASGSWREYRAALFAQPTATGVTPRLWIMPRISIDPAAVVFYDENGIKFSTSVGTGKLAKTISIPLKFDASLPSPAEAVGIGAALKGTSLPYVTQPWLAAPNLPYVSPSVAMNPMISGMVHAAYNAAKPQYDAIQNFAQTYQGYQVQNATLKEVVATLLVNGDVVARRDYKGTLVSFDDTLPALVVVNPTLQQQNLIAQGEFEVNVGFRFLDANTASLDARYDLSGVMEQFLEETQKATTKSSSSGWQVLGFGNRRSRLKTSLDQHVQFNGNVASMAQTRMVTYDATDDMIDLFESHFFRRSARKT